MLKCTSSGIVEEAPIHLTESDMETILEIITEASSMSLLDKENGAWRSTRYHRIDGGSIIQ